MILENPGLKCYMYYLKSLKVLNRIRNLDFCGVLLLPCVTEFVQLYSE